MIDPSMFGLVAIYLAIIAMLTALSALGFQTAIVQNQKNDDSIHSGVFLLVIGLSLFAYLFLLIATDLFISFYKSTNYWIAISILGLTILLENGIIVNRARCIADMDLKFINVVRMVRNVSGALAGALFAYMGYELMALIGQQIIFSLTSTVLFVFFRPWKIKIEFDWQGVRKLFKFGSFVYLSQILNKGYTTLNNSVLGLNYSTASFAQMNKSKIVNILIVQNMSGYFSKILFPFLASKQSDHLKFKDNYLTCLKVTSVVGFGLTGIFGLSGSEVIRIVYGPQWEEAAQWIAIISLNIYAPFLISPMRFAALARGYSKELFVLNIFIKLFNASILIFSFFWRIETILKIMVLYAVIRCVIYVIFNASILRINIQSHLKSIFSALVAFCLSLLSLQLLRLLPRLDHFIMSSLFFSILFLAIVYFLERPFIHKIIIDIRLRRKKAESM